MNAVAVAVAVLAGGCAAVARYGITVLFASRAVPWAVLTVNVIASLVGGAVLGWSESGTLDSGTRLIVLGGIAGGLSTFSAWSVESVQLVRAGEGRVAALSVLGNLVLGLSAAALGYALAP